MIWNIMTQQKRPFKFFYVLPGAAAFWTPAPPATGPLAGPPTATLAGTPRAKIKSIEYLSF